MKKHWLKIFSCTVFILSVPVPGRAEPINDAIVAIVNNDVITLKDLKDYIGGVYRQLKIEHRSPQDIQQIMLSYEERGISQLVEDKLILAAATKKGIEIRPEVVNKRLKEIKDRYPTEDDFLNEITSQGLTVTDLKNKMMNQMKAKYEVDLEVREKVFVNPEEVTSYFNEHKQEFESKTKYNLDSIYIAFDKNKGGALGRIREARSKLAAGAAFDEISKEYSQSPSVGVLEQGQMIPAIEKKVFSLKEGELSQPLEVEGGVYLFKVNSIVPGGKKSLEEVKGDVYNMLFEQKFRDKFKTWIDKLRSKAYVEIRN